ncbi:palmitoyl-acyl carrier protein thioesterase, chloroplastic-like [Arachis ipaensis]|nr:palmitoyl-acyl carrier protein thioesterase, chloroplastic-like [Arachis ipaensis]
MVAPITTAASMCAFHNVVLATQNYGIKKGIKQGLGVKRGSCGGLQMKANAQNHNGDDKISKVVSKSSIRQNFTIRSYEVDANGIASIETLMNYFQSSIIDHCNTLGIHVDAAGSSKEMIKRNLVWVYSEMQVWIYRYPKWDDVVEVETWLSSEGKNAARFNWIVRDFKTNQMLNRASSVCVLMNKLTRRLSKIPVEVRREFESYLKNSRIIIEGDDKKIPKLDDTSADYICLDLKPRWSDIDINFHVNNAKYVSWILESIPESILMNYELSSLTLKFKRECKRDSKLQSLAEVCSDNNNNNNNNNVEYNHMLRSEDGVEILRGRTEWRLKPTNNFDIFNHDPEASIKDL